VDLFGNWETVMAEKNEDRRIQRTRKLLQDALLALILEKGYEAVTVQDVIDRANVGRSTFYAHFQDKEALFLSEFETLRTTFEHHLLSQPATDTSPWSLSLVMFRHAQENLQLYTALAGKQGGSLALTHLQKYLSALLRTHLKQQSTEKENPLVPPEILAHYLVSSFIALLTWWLDNDLPYSAERMNEMFRQLTQPGMEAVMQMG
jgi:AcrR family transcriptional regulator